MVVRLVALVRVMVAYWREALLVLVGQAGGLGLLEEVGDFGEEGWEFLLDDFPDFLVSDFGISMY